VKLSPENAKASNDARVHSLRHPAFGVVCPGCGARIGKPCVATVPFLGVGAVGAPLEGVHSERIEAMYEGGVA
jgi:hypothetical protein